MAHDAVARITDKLEDIVYLLAHGNLPGEFDDGILEAEVRCIDETISIGDVSQNTLGHVEMLQHESINAMVGSWISAQDNVRRHVLLHAATALNERETADAHILLHHNAAISGNYF